MFVVHVVCSITFKQYQYI